MDDVQQDRSDQELLSAYARGDQSALAALYHRHKLFCYRIAARHASDDSLAIDLVQDAFIYLTQNARKITLKGKLTTLLYPVILNSVRARIRKNHGLKFGEQPETAEPDLLIRPAATMDPALGAAIQGLSQQFQEVLLMRIVDEMSVQEVSQALAIPEGTVKSRLHTALAALRDNPHISHLMN